MPVSRFACLLAACLGLMVAGPAQARSLDDILKAGELRVGVNPTLPPRALFNEKNEIDGFEPELAKAVADSLAARVGVQSIPASMPCSRSGERSALAAVASAPARNGR